MKMFRNSLTNIKTALSIPLALVVGYIFVFGRHQNLQVNNMKKAMAHLSYSNIENFIENELEGFMREPRSNFVISLLQNHTRMFQETRVDCAAIIAGNDTEVMRGYSLLPGITLNKEDELAVLAKYYEATYDCSKFISDNGFIMHHLTQEEREFPLSFSILTYKDIEMLVRMLVAFYRPQNHFCIHVDIKAKDEFRKAVSRIVSCLPNVYLPRRFVGVEWGNWTIVEAEIICMEELYRGKKWKYFINLTGQEMPLKTNWELVRLLKAYNGGNDVDGSYAVRRPHRWSNYKSMQHKPEGIIPIQGSTHVAVNRDFVEFVLFSNMSQAIQKWLKPTLVPDETVFATINHNPQLGIRGSYRGLYQTEGEIGHKPFYTRYKMWYSDPCAKHQRNGICLLTIGDLERMTTSPFMIANKFHLNEDRLVISCLEEWLANKTLANYMGELKFDTTIYEESVIVRNAIGENETKSFVPDLFV